MTPSDRLILALDLDDPKEAIRLVDQLSGRIRIFKIGSILESKHPIETIEMILQEMESTE